MSDRYTFVTEVIFHNPDKADKVESALKKECETSNMEYIRLQIGSDNFFFAGTFKNLGGGPWPEIFVFDDPVLEVVVLRDDGVVWKDREVLKEQTP